MLVHLGQHVVQAMAELMEQGDDVIVRQQCGLLFAVDFHSIGKVADQLCHRCLHLLGVGAQPAGDDFIHPGTAAFAVACRRVQIELAYQMCALRPGAFNPVELHIRVPNGCLVARDDEIKQRLGNLEQAGQNLGECEVLFDFLFAEGVARFLEFFADIRPIPGLRVGQLQVFTREGAHIGQVLLGKGTGLGTQITQEADHGFR